MKYEIVTLNEKIAVGISARTNNLSPDMGAVIELARQLCRRRKI